MRIKQLHQLFLDSYGITTDSRKVSKKVLFFALKGDNFDGNEYASEALNKGASYAIIDDPKIERSEDMILVKDVLETLQELATYHRKYLKTPIISLTGSNGKTTTKELINAVLSKKYRTTATKGNLNNHIGVPLTLLSMTTDTEIGIVEMGANHIKEIEFLCDITQPDFGYITNFGKAHLEGFGSVEGVIKGKSELYDHLMKHNRYVFLNADDKIQKEKLGTYIKKFGFSQSDQDYFEIKMLEASPFVKVRVGDTHIISHLIGDYNFTNIAAAILIGKYFNIDIDDIKDAIEDYIPTNNRSQILEHGTNKVILDAYNANPTSMAIALHNLDRQTKTPKVAILGDMFELGKHIDQEHQTITALIDTLGIETAYLVGENFYRTRTDSNHIHLYRSFEDFKAELERQSIQDALILIKGSRGMALERTLEFL